MKDSSVDGRQNIVKENLDGSKNHELSLLCGPLCRALENEYINMKSSHPSFQNKSLFLVRSFGTQSKRRERYLWIPHLGGILSLPLEEIWHSSRKVPQNTWDLELLTVNLLISSTSTTTSFTAGYPSVLCLLCSGITESEFGALWSSAGKSQISIFQRLYSELVHARGLTENLTSKLPKNSKYQQ